jgi:predicted RNase H-like HicB family nuclease
MKYVFTAIFNPESGGYNVHFPDLPGCHTCGDTLRDALGMAEDALCLWLCHLERENRPVPAATAPDKIKAPDGDFITAVAADTDEYRRYLENKTVRKTLSIPMWLNQKAKDSNINLSKTLQNALKAELNLPKR